MELDRAEQSRGISPSFRHQNLHFENKVFTCEAQVDSVSMCHCLVLPLFTAALALHTAACELWGRELPSHPGVRELLPALSLERRRLQLPQTKFIAVVSCQTQKTQGLISCEACDRWEVCSEQREGLAQSPGTAQL